MFLKKADASDPTCIFHDAFFTRQVCLAYASSYIRSMHPKTEIQPRPDSIQKILNLGWVGQLKIHGHRAQLHVSSKVSDPILAFTRQGKPHTKALSEPMCQEIRRLFTPKKGWNVIDSEWRKEESKLYVFDYLKKEGELLRGLAFVERWKMLPRDYLSPHLVTLPLLRDLPSCIRALASKETFIEGLVFKSSTSKGFGDTSIVRCRRPSFRE